MEYVLKTHKLIYIKCLFLFLFFRRMRKKNNPMIRL